MLRTTAIVAATGLAASVATAAPIVSADFPGMGDLDADRGASLNLPLDTELTGCVAGANLMIQLAEVGNPQLGDLCGIHDVLPGADHYDPAEYSNDSNLIWNIHDRIEPYDFLENNSPLSNAIESYMTCYMPGEFVSFGAGTFWGTGVTTTGNPLTNDIVDLADMGCSLALRVWVPDVHSAEGENYYTDGDYFYVTLKKVVKVGDQYRFWIADPLFDDNDGPDSQSDFRFAETRVRDEKIWVTQNLTGYNQWPRLIDASAPAFVTGFVGVRPELIATPNGPGFQVTQQGGGPVGNGGGIYNIPTPNGDPVVDIKAASLPNELLIATQPLAGETNQDPHKDWILIESMSSPIFRTVPGGPYTAAAMLGDFFIGARETSDGFELISRTRGDVIIGDIQATASTEHVLLSRGGGATCEGVFIRDAGNGQPQAMIFVKIPNTGGAAGAEHEIEFDVCSLVPDASNPSDVLPAHTGTETGLLLPAVQKARDAAAKSQCSNNLKQIGLFIPAEPGAGNASVAIVQPNAAGQLELVSQFSDPDLNGATDFHFNDDDSIEVVVGGLRRRFAQQPSPTGGMEWAPVPTDPDPVDDFFVQIPDPNNEPPILNPVPGALPELPGFPGVCEADRTTTNTNPGDADYNTPDGNVNGADLSHYVEAWLNGDDSADMTTTNTNPGDAGYGDPDANIDGADLSFFVEAWLNGCP